MSAQSLSQQLQKARERLELRFSDFEKSLFEDFKEFRPPAQSAPPVTERSEVKSIEDELGPLLGQKPHPMPAHAPAPAAIAPPPPAPAPVIDEAKEKEILHLKKTVQDQEAEILTYRKTAETLQSSLKELTGERQALLGQIQTYVQQAEDLAKKPRTGNPEDVRKYQQAIMVLEKQLARAKVRRQRSAAFWRQKLHFLRAHKKMLKSSTAKYEEMSKQIVRLTAELDSSLELIAELRDELHMSHQKKS